MGDHTRVVAVWFITSDSEVYPFAPRGNRRSSKLQLGESVDSSARCGLGRVEQGRVWPARVEDLDCHSLLVVEMRASVDEVKSKSKSKSKAFPTCDSRPRNRGAGSCSRVLVLTLGRLSPALVSSPVWAERSSAQSAAPSSGIQIYASSSFT